ncbi:MAG TPA: PepSY domain-containing protein, partial [Candidatus Methanoperedens sp.]|nr:PepSY domain-containing protein [Candidatus Methanoperedens sp.]
MMSGNGPGSGMMGYGNGANASYGSMMSGNGTGHCGAGYTDSGYGANATPITIEKAKESVEQYLTSTGNSDLKLSEVIEFDNNFYAGVKEQSTGAHAFELLVNKYTGAVFPEMGPNMMWNTKYGHMNRNIPAQTNISEEQALKNAQDYLDKALPGTKVGNADAFYGYYTIEVQKDSNIYGMLSVNSNTGAVWYHNWHGAFVEILEVG